MTKTVEITLSDDKAITIGLLPLRAYGDLLVALQDVFKEAVSKFDELDTEALIAMLPTFIRDHMEQVGAVIQIGTRGQVTAREALDERGLDDAIVIVTAILETNDVDGMIKSIKKATAVFRKTKATPHSHESALANPLA